MREVNQFGRCPKCGSDWDGGEMPEALRKHFDPPYRSSRLIGFEDPTIYDGAAWYVCPDCLRGFAAIPGVEDKQFRLEV